MRLNRTVQYINYTQQYIHLKTKLDLNNSVLANGNSNKLQLLILRLLAKYFTVIKLNISQ